MCHPAQLPVERLLADCRITRSRGTGPGGQHRNKVETAIVVEHLPTGLRGSASERRSQLQNRRKAIRRLRVKLAIEVRTESTTQPSEIWRRRVTDGRISVHAQHDDFPALLAEVLDALAAVEYSLGPATRRLGVTTSQLVKFLKVERAALIVVNRGRHASGELPLR